MKEGTVQVPAGYGARLKKLRKAAGFTAQEIADKIGLSRNMITNYENENQMPGGLALVQLARLYSSTSEYIVYGEDSNDKNSILDPAAIESDIVSAIQNIMQSYKKPKTKESLNASEE